MSILAFLASNWDSVLLVAAVIATAIILYKKGETRIIRTILFHLVTKAESEFGSGTGELKRAAVIEWLYGRLPAVIRLLITQKDIDNLIEDVLDYAKRKWAANPALGEHIEGAKLYE